MLIAIILLVISIYIAAKNTRTFIVHNAILNAISIYRHSCIDKNEKPIVWYDDMESYNLTMLKFWDWGYKHILPPEKYEIIKPFINIKKEK